MNDNDRYKLLGYASILRSCSANGRHNHQSANYLQAIQLHIHVDKPLDPDYEVKIRHFIHKVFDEQLSL